MISQDPVFDFQNADLVRFAQSGKSGDKERLQSPPIRGFHSAQVTPIQVGSFPQPAGARLFVPWTIVQTWALDERAKPNWQRIQTFKVETTGSRAIEVALLASLQVKDGIPSANEQKIVDAFNNYTLATGEIQAYVAQCLRASPEIDPYSFTLLYLYDVTLGADIEVDQTAIDRVRHQKEFLQGERFRLTLLSETALSVLRPVPSDPNVTESKDPASAVKGVAKANEPSGCDGMTTQYKEISRLDIAPQTRMTWGWHTVTVGCAKIDLYYPETQVRNQQLAAYSYWTWPTNLNDFIKKQVQDCATDSAILAVVVVIVFEDIDAALASFKSLFWACIRTKLGQALGCIDVGLVVNVDVIDDWH